MRLNEVLSAAIKPGLGLRDEAWHDPLFEEEVIS